MRSRIGTGLVVLLTFANGQQTTQIWGGRTTLSSNPYLVNDETRNGNLAANAGTSFGFPASWAGPNNAPTLTRTRTP